jgi:hypothetical protein
LLSQEAFRATPLGSVVLRNAAFTVKFLNRDIEACLSLNAQSAQFPAAIPLGKGLRTNSQSHMPTCPHFPKSALERPLSKITSPEALELNLKV